MKNFDFDNIGKTMPYTVDDQFFDRITDETVVLATRKRAIVKNRWLRWGVVACAAVACMAIASLFILPAKESITLDTFLTELSYEELDELTAMIDNMYYEEELESIEDIVNDIYLTEY